MSEPFREVVFLVNGKSRTGAPAAAAAVAALEAAGFTVRSTRVTSRPREFEGALDRFLADGEPLIAIGGGDGTQRMAAEKIAGTSSTMAVFPMGTGNAWAADLGIPTGAQRTANTLAVAQATKIDLGIANGRGFVNVATVGFTSLIVKNLPTELKGKLGRFVYFPAILRSLRELRPFHLLVTTENGGYEGMAIQFVAAAGRAHAGPFKVTKAASHSDGLLSLYTLDKTDSGGLFRFGLGLLTGRHTSLKEVWSCEAETAKVRTKPKKRIIMDGERAGSTPLDLTIRDKVLSVLIPGSVEVSTLPR